MLPRTRLTGGKAHLSSLTEVFDVAFAKCAAEPECAADGDLNGFCQGIGLFRSGDIATAAHGDGDRAGFDRLDDPTDFRLHQFALCTSVPSDT